MKEIKIQVPEGKRAEWINSVLTLVDEPKEDNRPVTERIKTFEDACKELGNKHPFVSLYNVFENKINSLGNADNDADVLTYLKLRIIVTALNEGWEPQFTTDEYRYYPWFYFYTKEEYDKMDEDRKRHCVLRSGNYTYVYVYYDASFSHTSVGSRLVFRTSALAKYAGEQFIEEWDDFLFKPRVKQEK